MAAAKPKRWVLLLRGVNVGKKNSLPMAELRAMLERAGCANVTTYIQSGNAVLETQLPEKKLKQAIEQALADYMGRPIATTLRSLEDLESVIARNPFEKIADDPSRLFVTFLDEPLKKDDLAGIDPEQFEPELFKPDGREIYMWLPAGAGRSALATELARSGPKTGATTRNWRTVLKLREMAK